MTAEKDETTETLTDADPSSGAAAGDGRGEESTTTTLTDTEATRAEELLASLREERDRLKDQLLRTAADYDNFRKRTRKDLEEAERRGREEAVRELLPVFDNLERAVGAASSATGVTSIVDGLRMVLKLFEDHAGRLGIVRITAVGERFDPAIHDAIQQVETDEHAPGTVITEIVPGFKLGERLVRPAMVVVARKPSASS